MQLPLASIDCRMTIEYSSIKLILEFGPSYYAEKKEKEKEE